MSAEWPDSFPSDAERSRLQASGWTADDIARLGGPQPKRLVWVATVSDDNDSPGPAVYVSDTQEDLIRVIRKQQGVPDDEEDILEWMESAGKVAVWDSYYVET